MIGYLFLSASCAAMPGVIVMIATGDATLGWRVFFAVWGALCVMGAVAFVFGPRNDWLDVSADINEISYRIRSEIGKDAQAEFLAEVARDAEPGKNSNARKFAPGHNHQTMLWAEKAIREKHTEKPQ